MSSKAASFPLLTSTTDSTHFNTQHNNVCILRCVRTTQTVWRRLLAPPPPAYNANTHSNIVRTTPPQQRLRGICKTAPAPQWDFAMGLLIHTTQVLPPGSPIPIAASAFPAPAGRPQALPLPTAEPRSLREYCPIPPPALCIRRQDTRTALRPLRPHNLPIPLRNSLHLDWHRRICVAHGPASMQPHPHSNRVWIVPAD